VTYELELTLNLLKSNKAEIAENSVRSEDFDYIGLLASDALHIGILKLKTPPRFLIPLNPETNIDLIVLDGRLETRVFSESPAGRAHQKYCLSAPGTKPISSRLVLSDRSATYKMGEKLSVMSSDILGLVAKPNATVIQIFYPALASSTPRHAWIPEGALLPELKLTSWSLQDLTGEMSKLTAQLDPMVKKPIFRLKQKV
jgi:hypothetical protein